MPTAQEILILSIKLPRLYRASIVVTQEIEFEIDLDFVTAVI